MLVSVIAGLGIGLLGSFHCIGMCGPIALSLPILGKSTIEKMFLIVLYNLGRASSYASMGLVFGYIGTQFVLFGFQQFFSITIGILLLLGLFFKNYLTTRFSLSKRIYAAVQSRLSKLLTSPKQSYSYFFIGFVNGFLPCGLVYLAIGSAMATGSVFGSAALMFMFGMGTFPLMISIMVFGQYISVTFRQRVRKFIPVVVFLTACVFLIRGLNLGIPYLSPQLHETAAFQQIKCHR